MDSVELKAFLAKLELSQSDFSRLIGVTPRAVNLWLAGTRSIPGPVSAYLKLYASLPTGMQQAERFKYKENQSMKNGMYQIDFMGQSGDGHGTLVFEDGRIFGADIGGGKYDGEFEYNELTGLIEINIRVQMMANHPSVVGVVQPFDWILEVSATTKPGQESGKIDVHTKLGRSIVAQYKLLRALPEAA